MTTVIVRKRGLKSSNLWKCIHPTFKTKTTIILRSWAVIISTDRAGEIELYWYCLRYILVWDRNTCSAQSVSLPHTITEFLVVILYKADRSRLLHLYHENRILKQGSNLYWDYSALVSLWNGSNQNWSMENWKFWT